MKYYKLITGYYAIDETTQINANGKKIPTNLLAYGRGPERPLDAGSVASRVFDVVALTREGQQVEAEEVPGDWRVALGLVKVEPVCPMPAGKTPVVVTPTDNRPELSVTHQVFFLFGFLVGVVFTILLSLYR